MKQNVPPDATRNFCAGGGVAFGFGSGVTILTKIDFTVENFHQTIAL